MSIRFSSEDLNNKSNNFALLGDNLIGDANSVLFRISDDRQW